MCVWTSDGVHLNWHLFNNPLSVLQGRSAHCWAKICIDTVTILDLRWERVLYLQRNENSELLVADCLRGHCFSVLNRVYWVTSHLCALRELCLWPEALWLVSQCSCSWDASGTINTLCECCCSVPRALPGQAVCDTESESKAPNCPEKWVHVGTPTVTAPLVCICLKFCSGAAVLSW